MGDEFTFKTRVQYVKPEALNLGPAAEIEGGEFDCPTGNMAFDDCAPYGFYAKGTKCDTGSHWGET